LLNTTTESFILSFTEGLTALESVTVEDIEATSLTGSLLLVFDVSDVYTSF
jgi:hypothetical protein